MSRFWKVYLSSLVAAALVIAGLAPAETLAAIAVLGSTEVDAAFIKQYSAEAKLAYQRMGSKLRNFVRRQMGVNAQDLTFPKIGRGSTSSKGRHDDVTPMNLSHTSVTATLVDRYAAEYVDKLDQLKTNVELIRPYAMTAGMALGRYADSQIVTAIETATNTTSLNLAGSTAGAVTTLEVGKVKARLIGRNVPDDGRLVCAVTPLVWGKLMSLQEFSNSQWVGPDALPFKTQMEAKFWNGVTWMQFTGLTQSNTTTSTGSTEAACQMWHPDAVGHAVGADITTEITYQAQKVSTLVNAYQSMGAVLIDGEGVEEFKVNENA